MTTSAKVLKIGQNTDHNFTIPFAPFDINTMSTGYRFVQPKDITEPLTGVWMWNQNTTVIDIANETTMLKSCFNYDIAAMFQSARVAGDSSVEFEWLQNTVYLGYWLCLDTDPPIVDMPTEDLEQTVTVTARKTRSTAAHPSVE